MFYDLKVTFDFVCKVYGLIVKYENLEFYYHENFHEATYSPYVRTRLGDYCCPNDPLHILMCTFQASAAEKVQIRLRNS